MAESAAESNWLAGRRRYRRLSVGALAAGVRAFAAADVAGHPVVGVAYVGRRYHR